MGRKRFSAVPGHDTPAVVAADRVPPAVVTAAIGEARIVFLGEATHMDGTAFDAKHRLITHLHGTCGFGVLAWEADPLDARQTDNLLGEGKIDEALRRLHRGSWAYEEVRPTLAYLASSRATGGPLRLAGFDSQLTATVDEGELREMLTESWPNLGSDAEIIAAFVVRGGYGPMDEERERGEAALRRTLVRGCPDPILGRLLQALVNTSQLPVARGRFLERIPRAALAELASGKARLDIADPDLKEAMNIRDAEMGAVLDWVANAQHSGSRIIGWLENIHAARNVGAVEGEPIHGLVTLGDVAWRQWGDRLYSVGFFNFGGSDSGSHAPPEDSLEALLHAEGAAEVFVDMRRLGPDHPLRQVRSGLVHGGVGLPANVGAGRLDRDWGTVFDGIFFFDQARTATRVAR